MYEIHVYEQYDFEPPDSEQTLVVYRGTKTQDLATSPGNIGHLLKQMLDVDISRDVGKSVANYSLDQWLSLAKEILSRPLKARDYDLSFVRSAKLINDERDDIVMVGEDDRELILIHWFTTA